MSLIGYALFNSLELHKNYLQLESSAGVNSQIMATESESYHTQLELWEYAYVPDRERLVAFEEHNKTLSDKLETVVSLSRLDNGSLYAGGRDDIADIESAIVQIQTDWIRVLSAIEIILIAKEEGQSIEEMTQPYLDARTILIENEFLFDSLALNKQIADFIQKEGEHIHMVAENMRDLKDTISITLLILAGVYMVLLILIAVWLGMLVTKIKTKAL
jgi:hypothetical protein